MSIDQLAANIRSAAVNKRLLMGRITGYVERKSKERTPVRTGHLRRSVTSRVEAAGERGIVGTNVSYARHVHQGTKYMRGRPFLKQGLDASRQLIDSELEQAGEKALTTIEGTYKVIA